MSDDELERELRQAADRFDPLPERARQGAVAAFTWRTVDAELARLAFDSLESATVRGPQYSRLFVFETDGLTIEIEVTGDGTGNRRIVGRLSPAQVAEIECRCGEQQTSTTTDDLGRFTIEVPPVGAFRLVCRRRGAGAVATEWVSA
jgi:hypothetical protein